MVTHYDRSSHRYQLITRKLAIFLGCTIVPNSLVENEEFLSLIQTLDPRYKVPGRTSVSKEIDKVIFDMKASIQKVLADAHKVSLCTDIWTKKGLTSSYLGLTAHFFSRYDHRRHRITLAVRQIMQHPHNAETIREMVEEILKEWGIPLDKILAILTDNGSNMIKAFREQCFNGDNEEDEISSENEAISFDEEEQDFESREVDHDVAFSLLGRRIGCFSHTLQLIVHRFSIEPAFKQLLSKVHSLVSRVNKSSVATEKLLSLCHKKLVGDCPTRWSSTFLMIEHLLEVKESLKTVLDVLEWDNLATSEWKSLENIHKLLKPFAQYTSLISGDEYTTMSCVVPAVMELNLHLEDMKKITEVKHVASHLQSELKRRFRKCTDPGDFDFDPVYLMSTLLDPRYSVLLNNSQLEPTKTHLLRLLKDMNGGVSSPSPRSSVSSPVHPPNEDLEPPEKKRFCHLAKVLEEKLKEGAMKASKEPPGRQELQHYLLAMHTLPEDADPLSFWVEEEKNYPLLSTVALDLLTIPGSSAPIERAFSTAGESTSGKRNRLTAKNLEREVLLRKNKQYLYM